MGFGNSSQNTPTPQTGWPRFDMLSRTLYSAFLGLHHKNKKIVMCYKQLIGLPGGGRGITIADNPGQGGEVGSENLHFQRMSFVNDP